jgi:rhodanese-related sulfurtransferase
MNILRFKFIGIFLLMVGTCIAGPVLAVEPVPITANAAFDAYATQTDPLTGFEMKVALVDVRSRAEYFWVGSATQVRMIELKNGSSIIPDLGKVILDHEGKFLTYTLNGHDKRVQVKKVDSLVHSSIATNIPFKLWDESTATLEINRDFEDNIESLADYPDPVEVLILYCRTGGRSTSCTAKFDTSKFSAVYEIDDPAGNRGFGGFEGPSYSDVYNGYLGFPGRQTSVQAVPSVSWKDSGLPMKTLMDPLPDSR